MIGPVCHSRWVVRIVERHQNAGPWADSLRMIHVRHPEVAATMVNCLSGPTDMRHFSAVASCRVELRALGCNIPEWEDLPTALPRALAALVPGVLAIPEEGCQHDTSLVLKQRFVETAVVPRASPARGACSARKDVFSLASLSPL